MTSVIILAAGSGSRTTQIQNKVMYRYGGYYLIEYPIMKFLNNKNIDEVVLVCNEVDYESLLKLELSIKIVIGGKSRSESVLNGLKLVTNDKVLIHDGARVLVDDNLINRSVESLELHDVTVACIQLSDSLKKKKENNQVDSLNRNEYLLAQTPQCFKTEVLRKAYETTNNFDYYDDVSLVCENLNYDVYYFLGDRLNIKYTYDSDLDIIKSLIDKIHD